MSAVTVVPKIEPRSNGFMLLVESVDAQRAWRKWYGTEQDAYTDAVDMGLADDEFFGSTHRRKLKTKVSIAVERFEHFGLQAD
jgi:hypothetical protein